MKHLKSYKIFESAQALTEEQIQFLNKNTKGTWSLNPSTGKIDVNGNFDCSNQNLKDLKGIRFGNVGGDFYCRNNSLKTLEGAPETAGGNFSCSYNSLTSLEGAPETVGGNFYCHHNSLASLEGAPETVGGNFSCSYNSLKTLKGAPETVGGSFSCHHNSLASLEGAPKSVGGDFSCDAFKTQNWTIESRLKILETGSPKAKALMATLVSPEAFQKRIDQDPAKAAVALKSVWKTLKANPKYSSLEFPEGYSKEADLLADLNDIGL